MTKTFDNRLDELLTMGVVSESTQLSFDFENKVQKNSKPMSGDEYKQKIAQATERFIKRRELQFGNTTNDRDKSKKNT